MGSGVRLTLPPWRVGEGGEGGDQRLAREIEVPGAGRGDCVFQGLVMVADDAVEVVRAAPDGYSWMASPLFLLVSSS